jgi:hypothetical protein
MRCRMCMSGEWSSQGTGVGACGPGQRGGRAAGAVRASGGGAGVDGRARDLRAPGASVRGGGRRGAGAGGGARAHGGGDASVAAVVAGEGTHGCGWRRDDGERVGRRCAARAGGVGRVATRARRWPGGLSWSSSATGWRGPGWRRRTRSSRPRRDGGQVIGRQQRTEEENAMSTVSGQRARVAAIYARVSSERQRQEQTIASVGAAA